MCANDCKFPSCAFRNQLDIIANQKLPAEIINKEKKITSTVGIFLAHCQVVAHFNFLLKRYEHI